MAEVQSCTFLTKRRHRIIAILIILIIGMLLGGALGHARGEGRFARGGMMYEGKTFNSERMEKSDCNKKEGTGNKTCTVDPTIAATIKDAALKTSALQDDYQSMWRFIQRNDTTNASARIDVVVAELNQLKTLLPKMADLTNTKK